MASPMSDGWERLVQQFPPGTEYFPSPEAAAMVLTKYRAVLSLTVADAESAVDAQWSILAWIDTKISFLRAMQVGSDG